MRRALVPPALGLVGFAAIVAATVATSVTSKAIWIGVVSTTLTAALVDGSALLEARRRDRALLKVAGDRVGDLRAHYRLVLNTMYNVTGSEASAELRQMAPPSVDLSESSGFLPPTTKGDWLTHTTQHMAFVLDQALQLGATTSEAWRFVELDLAMRENALILYLQSVVSAGAVFDPQPKEHLTSAADLLDLLDENCGFFKKVAGAEWKYE